MEVPGIHISLSLGSLGKSTVLDLQNHQLSIRGCEWGFTDVSQKDKPRINQVLRCCSFHQDYEDHDEKTEKPTESTMAQWHNGTTFNVKYFGHFWRCHRFILLQARRLAMSQGEARTVSIVTILDSEKCYQTRPERLVFSKRFMAISPPYEATNQIQPMSTSIQPAGGFNMFQLQLFFSVHIFSSTVNDAVSEW